MITRLNNKPQSGFTLLEVLITIVIIAILTGIGVMSLAGLGSGDEAETNAKRIAALLRLASDEAVLSATEMGLYFEEGRYQFLVFSGSAWLPIQNDELFRERALPAVLDIDLIQHGEPLMLAAAQAAEEEDDEAQEENEQSIENNPAENSENTDDAEEPAHPPPQILILSGGGFSPFELVIEAPNNPTTWIVKGGLAGEITVERKE